MCHCVQNLSLHACISILRIAIIGTQRDKILPSQTTDPESQDSGSNPLDVYSVGSGPVIKTDRIALQQLKAFILESVNAVRGHGVEIGGLITAASADWIAPELVLTDFVPVSIEHKFGPAFKPSQSDVETFKQAAAELGDTVTGYFRSQIRGDDVMRQEDSNLLAQLFPAKDSCFVRVVASSHAPGVVYLTRVKPDGVSVPLGSFPLSWNSPAPFVINEVFTPLPASSPKPNRARVADFPAVPGRSYSEETWGGPVLPGAPGAPPAASEERVPVLAALARFARFSPFDAEQSIVESTRGVPKSKGTLWALGGAIAALAFVAALYTGEKRYASQPVPATEVVPPAPPAPAPDTEPKPAKLNLQITRTGDQVEIRWDPASPAVRTSVRGALIIPGGAPIELNADQVRSGFFSYKRPGSFPTFELMIYQADGSFTGETEQVSPELIASSPPKADSAAVTAPEPPSLLDARTKEIASLQTDIPLLLEAKLLDQAEVRINELQRIAPGELQGSVWQNVLRALRSAGQTPPAPAAAAQVPTQEAPKAIPPPRTPVAPAQVPTQEPPKAIAVLRTPPLSPVPVESAIALPSTLPPPVMPEARSTIININPPAGELAARIGTIAGWWAYFNPKAPRPRITNGFQFYAETVSVSVAPDGRGMIDYAVKSGIWHLAQTSVQFHFRLDKWDGRKFLGRSDDEGRDYSLTLEPSQSGLSLVWWSPIPSGKLHVGAGQAILNRRKNN